MLIGDERHAPRAGHQRNFAQVDAAADDDQPHAETEDAENGDAADQAEDIPRRRKARQRQCKDNEQNDDDCGDDLFLAQLVEAAPPRRRLAGCGGRDGCHKAFLCGNAISGWRRT
jgi:hypothetical protein